MIINRIIEAIRDIEFTNRGTGIIKVYMSERMMNVLISLSKDHDEYMMNSNVSSMKTIMGCTIVTDYPFNHIAIVHESYSFTEDLGSIKILEFQKGRDLRPFGRNLKV